MVSLVDFSHPAQGQVLQRLEDAALLSAYRALTVDRQRLDAWAAKFAGEFARRSAPDLGGDGLARRLGARSPENLVQQLTGSTAREASTLLRVGTSALTAVTTAVADGAVSVASADAIISGLGTESPSTSAGELAQAAAGLVAVAPELTPEQLGARAREERALLDASAIDAADAERRAGRYLALSPQPDGMTRIHGLLDPESAAIVKTAFDSATSPRRGGPRFVRHDQVARVERIERDPRTPGQLALDAFVHLIEAGHSADPSRLLPPGPALKVAITRADLTAGTGPAFIDGQSDPTTTKVAERVACTAGIRYALLDDSGRALDLGRTQRLFTAKQREMLALRDGGCRYPRCERPPSWTEAHHITPWDQGGSTDVRDGILLCRYHHLHIHNTGARIRRDGDDYLLIPPRSRDPEQRPIPLPTKSPLVRRLRN